MPEANRSSEELKFCVFLPGLGLSSRNRFAQKFLEVMAKDGFISVVVNAQGIELPLKKGKFWHPGHYHDAKMVLNFIQCHYPKSRVYLVGFSAGSNIIHKLVLNYHHRKDFIRGAVAVCVNGDYLATRKHLESTLQGKLYSALLAMGQKDILQRNDHVHPTLDATSLKKLASCRFVSEYDAIAWEALYGFESEQDYYNAISSNFTDRRLNVPYLAIQPRDDPLHAGNTRENVKVNDFYENPSTIYMEPKYGNHFGFYEGPLLSAFSNRSSYTYPAKVAREFFREIDLTA
jgi:predicted alpha/beta-fold hydrolase